MKKFLVVFLFLSSFAMADASISITGSADYLDAGTGSSLTNLINGGTMMFWYNIPAVPPVTSNSLLRAAGSGVINNGSGGGSLQVVIGRGTQSLLANAALSAMPAWVANQWVFVVAVWNPSGANNDQHLYVGSSTHTVTEATSYAIQRVGSGTLTAMTHAYFAGDPSNSLPLVGKIAFIGAWNRQLSLAEIQDQQYTPHITSGCVLFVYTQNGLGTQYDLSGNGNNMTVTGGSVSPLGPPISIGGSSF